MQSTPLDWATVDLVEDNIMKWRAVINGPVRHLPLMRYTTGVATFISPFCV